MQMISTVAGAEDLYRGSEGEYKHQDELWIWIPFTEQSIGHLKGFLSAFSASPQFREKVFLLSFTQIEPKIMRQSLQKVFCPRQKNDDQKGAFADRCLKFKAGMINSRKAMISPYLPKL